MADDDVAEGEINLATLTRLELFPRYLYRVGDKPLDTPVNLRAVAWSLLLIPGAWLLSSFTPLSASGGMGFGLVPRLILPGLLVWVVLTKVGNGAKPWEVLHSYTRLGWHYRRRPVALRPVRLHSHVREAPHP